MERYRIVEGVGIYFVTFTIVEWIPVFIEEATCKIFTESLNFSIKNKGDVYPSIASGRRERGLWIYPLCPLDISLKCDNKNYLCRFDFTSASDLLPCGGAMQKDNGVITALLVPV